MTETCPVAGDLVSIEMGRIATQYREAERFKGYMRAVLALVEEVAIIACGIPEAFDIRTAVGDQLSIIGKRMGFPRAHCSCEISPVYGIACETSTIPIAGVCDDATWFDCGAVVNSTLRLDDDEFYRSHLLARRYQMLGLYDVDSLTAAVRHVWGATAWVVASANGIVTVAPGRDLSVMEIRAVPVTFRVLPFAPGVRRAIHLGTDPVLGAGVGWGETCSGDWLCGIEIDTGDCITLEAPLVGAAFDRGGNSEIFLLL